MLGNRKLILDTFCEVYDLLKPWMDQDIWDFSQWDLFPGAIYLISRKELFANLNRIREIAEQDLAKIIISNPAEGSETMIGQMRPIQDLIFNQKILLIGGGNMDARYPCLQYDSFLPKILDYDENLLAIAKSDEIYTKLDKPYKFLFLNGRLRLHRKYLIDRWHQNNLIDQSIWTILDTNLPTPGDLAPPGDSTIKGKTISLTTRAHKYLDPKYEVDRYANRTNLPLSDRFMKNKLFNNEWGEIYLNSEPYIDTYFSVVTETVFDYPYSFRTEKIWKPIAMGHPWIAVANAGYYRDIRNLGFKTFDGIIDESFDQIDNNQDRIKRIAQVVEDLCQQDLVSFLKECYTVCRYNQQHLVEMRLKVRQEFPERFFKFVNCYLDE
jgi:hypothetical protein